MAGYQPFQPYRTTPSNPYGFNSTQPVYPGMDTDVGGGGAWDWIKDHLGDLGSFVKDNWKDIANTGADAAGAYLDYDAKQKALGQQKEQFEKQYGLANNAQQASIQSMINRAPLADKGQALSLNFAAPTPYQPRDFTRGIDQLRQAPTGGAAAQMQANAAAAANYKQGDGGVDTQTLKMILARLQQGQGASPTQLPPGVTNSPPGATDQLTMGTAYNKPEGGPGVTPGAPNKPGTDNQYGFSLPEKPTLSQVYAAWDRVHPGQAPPAPTSGELMRFWQEYRQSVQGGG